MGKYQEIDGFSCKLEENRGVINVHGVGDVETSALNLFGESLFRFMSGRPLQYIC